MMKQTLRTDKTEEIYAEYRKTNDFHECAMCREAKSPKKEFKNWYVVANRFPYDRVAEIHDMLVLKRHAKEITLHELAEMEALKQEFTGHYDCVVENLITEQTVPNHFHLHLIRYIRK